jgi:acetyl esterase/lipase
VEPVQQRYGWSAYLARTWYSSRDAKTSTPPAWVGVGTFDLFHDEMWTCRAAQGRGVPCEVEIVAGAFHGFDGIVPKAHVSQAFFNSQCALLRRAFEPAAA